MNYAEVIKDLPEKDRRLYELMVTLFGVQKSDTMSAHQILDKRIEKLQESVNNGVQGIMLLNEKVSTQNGRVAKLESKWDRVAWSLVIGSFATIGSLIAFIFTQQV